MFLEKRNIKQSLVSKKSSTSKSIQNELDRRLKRLKNNTVQFKTWDEVKKTLHKND